MGWHFFGRRRTRRATVRLRRATVTWRALAPWSRRRAFWPAGPSPSRCGPLCDVR